MAVDREVDSVDSVRGDVSYIPMEAAQWHLNLALIKLNEFVVINISKLSAKLGVENRVYFQHVAGFCKKHILYIYMLLADQMLLDLLTGVLIAGQVQLIHAWLWWDFHLKRKKP